MSEEAASAAADQASFESALAAALAVAGPELEQTAATDTAAPTTPDPAPAASTQAQPPAAPDAPPAPSAKELERITALEAREAAIRAREAALEPKKAPDTGPFDYDRFIKDPVRYLRSARPDLSPAEAARAAESLYMHALGDKAPPEYKAKQEVAEQTTEVKTEVQELRAKIQELENARLQEGYAAQMREYQGELKAAAVAASDAPIVASLAKRNPDRAAELLIEVARREAHESTQRGAAEPVVLTAPQAVAKLEALLKAQRDELYGPSSASVESQPHALQSQLSPTITNRDASVQPPRTPVDQLDDKALRAAALKAAGLEHVPTWD